MAKMLNMRDFDFTAIGTIFELDEVTPKFATEERTNDQGKTIMGQDGQPRKFNTDEIVGYKYSVTITEGNYRKKATQVTVNSLDNPITNKEILKRESVKCKFVNLEPSMIGNPMYFKADKIQLIDVQK
ncbi:hypothetical protein [Enterococcus sp. AZ136]|uniref:hypothetical protein n=1 Tax=Enterococcus sp. AZ136 TaxID=2774788 RepID=UPI003D285F5E